MLYIIATPIGNLKDITYRAVETLGKVNYILCEDTRTSSVLLKHYNINKPLYAYHKFNEKAGIAKIVADLQSGLDIALISDAGTPIISDPGFDLLNAVIEAGLPYTALPGPSAVINAVVLSGFAAPFTFVGFLPSKNTERRELLKDLKDQKHTMVFYCSPYDLEKDLFEMSEVFGDRKIAVVREMTKIYEEVVFSTLEKGYGGKVLGEFVLLVSGATNNESPLNALSVEEHLQFYVNLGYKKSDAIEMVARERGMKKNEVYKHSFDLPVDR